MHIPFIYIKKARYLIAQIAPRHLYVIHKDNVNQAYLLYEFAVIIREYLNLISQSDKKFRAVFPQSLLDTSLDDIFYIGQNKKGQKSGVNEG